MVHNSQIRGPMGVQSGFLSINFEPICLQCAKKFTMCFGSNGDEQVPKEDQILFYLCVLS